MFFIQQANNYDCGFTCLKILLANIHHDRNYLFLLNPFKEDVSFLELMTEASKYGVSLNALKAVNKEEIRKFNDFPIIARMKINNMYHAVYVYKRSKKYIYYYDPKRDKKKLLYDEFIYLWTGEFLAIKDYNKTPCPTKKIRFITNLETIITFVISLLSTVSALLGVYFINKDSYIYLPIIFLSLMLILEILQKKYSLIIMNHIDERILEKVEKIKKKEYYAFYEASEQYKKYLLINNLTIFSSFAFFLLISLIFIFNDKINFIYIVINLVLAFAYSLFIHPDLNKDRNEISEVESLINYKEDKLEAFSLMKEARNKAYKYICKEYSFKYVVIALEVLLTFIIMMYLKLVNVTYIICYTVLQLYLYNSLVNLLTSNDNQTKQDNYLNKIIDITEINSQ